MLMNEYCEFVTFNTDLIQRGPVGIMSGYGDLEIGFWRSLN